MRTRDRPLAEALTQRLLVTWRKQGCSCSRRDNGKCLPRQKGTSENARRGRNLVRPRGRLDASRRVVRRRGGFPFLLAAERVRIRSSAAEDVRERSEALQIEERFSTAAMVAAFAALEAQVNQAAFGQARAHQADLEVFTVDVLTGTETSVAPTDASSVERAIAPWRPACSSCVVSSRGNRSKSRGRNGASSSGRGNFATFAHIPSHRFTGPLHRTPGMRSVRCMGSWPRCQNLCRQSLRCGLRRRLNLRVTEFEASTRHRRRWRRTTAGRCANWTLVPHRPERSASSRLRSIRL